METDVQVKARQLHERSLVFDALSLWYVPEEKYFQKVVAGGVNATVITANAGNGRFTDTLELIDYICGLIENSENMCLATTAAAIREAHETGKVAFVLGFQDGSVIEDKLAYLRTFYRLGVRCLQPAYTGGNLIGDGCGELRDGGLTFWGMEVIEEANRLGMLIDLSHCGDRTTMDVIKMSKSTPVFTHANARGVCHNARNKSDEAIKAIAERGGFIGVTPLPAFVSQTQTPTLDILLDHIDYLVNLAGIDHVGIGTDFTEGLREKGKIFEAAKTWRERRPDIFGTVEDFYRIPYAEGIEDISKLPRLTEGLVRRGYSDDAIEKILGLNFLRVFAEVVG